MALHGHPRSLILAPIESANFGAVPLGLHCVSKKRAPFLFLRLFCVLLTDLKNIWQNYSKENLQQNTHFKIYIDAWYLICNLSRKHVQKKKQYSHC